MTTFKAGDLKKMPGSTATSVRWSSRYGHDLSWLRVSGQVFLRTPDGAFYELESAESAVEAKQRYVNFRESDQ